MQRSISSISYGHEITAGACRKGGFLHTVSDGREKFGVEIMLSNYDEFATIYDRHWGTDSLGWFPELERLVLDRLDPNGYLLDFCCGTGRLAEKLAGRGFRTVGIDASFEMLRHAAVNAPGCAFICADIRSFCLSRKFDAAVALYDSLNHMLTLNDLETALLNVSDCLASGGAFAFDLNTEIKYRLSWSGTTTIDDPDMITTVTASYSEDTRLAEFRATISSRDSVRSASVRLVQTWYPVSTVVEVLGRSGFSEISCVSLGRNQRVEDAGRVLFVSRK